MIIVIQCAASKQLGAGHLVSSNGTPVDFVADPQAAPPRSGRVFARPDDISDERIPWRHVLLKYNQDTKANPLGLYPAYQLYENRIYGRLVDRFGLQKVYILSAGWGLIAAHFLTPYYDITFSQSAELYKRRRKTDRYNDLCMLPPDADDELLFFGGKDYLPLFCSLTSATRTTKTVFYNSTQRPQVTGCVLKRFATTTRTNWHYECANAFLDGAVSTGQPTR
jgi:hypothetical protein